MKLFSRTPSPLSLEPPLSVKSSNDAPPSPSIVSGPPSRTTSASDASSPSTPSPAATTTRISSSSTTASTPRRPRLHHGAPPFYQCWANVRQSSNRRSSLRFCTVSGPTLRLSATPSGDVLGTSVCVYGANITTDEFPSLRIVIRMPSTASSSSTRIILSADSKSDHAALASHLMCASKRSISSDYTFANHIRDGIFSRVCSAEDHSSFPVCVKVVSKQVQNEQKYQQYAQLARREPVILLCLPGHPTLTTIRDVYESARAYYVVTEGLPTDTLKLTADLRGKFCERDVAVVISDLLNALVQLRSVGLVHRFLCPDSIVVDQDESRVRSVTIVDFEMSIRPSSKTEPIVPDTLPPCPPLLQMLKDDVLVRKQHAAYIPPEAYGEDIQTSNMNRREAGVDDNGVSIEESDDFYSKDDSGIHTRQKRDMDMVADMDGENEHADVDDESKFDVPFAHDVWSVGMIMHWMLVGCTPFDEHVESFDSVSTLVADAHGMPVFSGPLWRGVTSGAKHLCASLLHADARARLSASRALQHPWLRL